MGTLNTPHHAALALDLRQSTPRHVALSLELRQSQLFAAPRDQLHHASQLFAALVPSPRNASCFVCPVPGCKREDRHAQLAMHMLAEHFDVVRAAAAVLARVEGECCSQDACVLTPAHFKPLKGTPASMMGTSGGACWSLPMPETLVCHTTMHAQAGRRTSWRCTCTTSGRWP